MPLITGLRPFGVSILYAGYDAHHQFQLYLSDPSGNYSGWKATCVGNNNGTATSLLKQDYKEDCTLEDAVGLALKVLSKTMDSTSLDSEKRESVPMRAIKLLLTAAASDTVEFATMSIDKRTDKPLGKIFKPKEIDALLEKHGLAKPKEGEGAPAAGPTPMAVDASS
jgi:20S proteasome subunit alpha 3